MTVALRPVLLDARGNPVMGSPQRMRGRALFGFPAGQYVGARGSRELAEWNPGAGSADGDSLGDLPTLRARTRDICRNSPIGAAAINTYTTSIVGTGIRPQPHVDADLLRLSPEAATTWQKRARKLWQSWAGTRACDLTRRMTFVDLMTIATRSEFESGDLFVVRRFKPRRDEPFGLRLQLVEADRVCNPNFGPDTEGLVGGISLDEDGAPQAYHILNRHPGEWGLRGTLEWSDVAAFGAETGEPMVLQVGYLGRPGQTRGIPKLAPVILILKQLTRYSEAEIMAALVSSMFTVFLKPGQGDIAGEGFAAIEATGGNANTAPASSSELKLGHGMITELLPGDDVSFASPTRPSQVFDAFMTAGLRQLGAAIEIPYEVLLKTFLASYSASRASLLEMWRAVYTNRERNVRQFAQPVYSWFIAECVARGLLAAPGFFEDPFARQAWLGCVWTGDAMGQIDPLKEVNAARERVRLGVSTLAIETSEITGEDWETVTEQRAHEVKRLRELGLPTEVPEKAPAARGALPLGAVPEDEPEDDPSDVEDETRPNGRGVSARVR